MKKKTVEKIDEIKIATSNYYINEKKKPHNYKMIGDTDEKKTVEKIDEI